LPKIDDIEHLLKTCDFVCNRKLISDDQYPLGLLESRYVGLYCSILTNNKKSIRKFLTKIIRGYCCNNEYKTNNAMLRLFQGMKLYFKLYYANVNSNKIKETIEKKYSEAIYAQIIKSLKELTYESLKEAMKKEKNNENEKSEDLKLRKALHNKYFENPPNQKELFKIINYKPTFKERVKNLFIS